MNIILKDVDSKAIVDIYGNDKFVHFERIKAPSKKLVNELKNEIEKRANKDELYKKIIFTDTHVFFINYVMDIKEHEKLLAKVGEDGVWFLEICTEDEVKAILNPQSNFDLLLEHRAINIIDNPRLLRVFKYRKKNYLLQYNSDWSLTKYFAKDKLFKQYIQKVKPHLRKKCESINAGFIAMPEINGICEKTRFGNIIYISEHLSSFLFYMNLVMIEFDDFGS